MKEKKIYKIFNKIDYNNYDTAETVLKAIIVASLITYSDNTTLNTSLNLIKAASINSWLFLSLCNGKNHTKNIIEIKELYNEFLKSYNKLNKTFDLTDPVEIYTMYNYLLYKGYLSKDKKFKFSTENVKDLKNLGGTNILSGKGVCRHTSALLTDILNEEGIESNILGVYSPGYFIKVKVTDKGEYSKKDLLKIFKAYCKNKEEYEKMKELVTLLMDENKQNLTVSLNPIDNKGLVVKKYGNHAITMAKKNNYNYFFDPTQKRIYRQNKNLLVDNETQLTFKPLATTALNNISKTIQIKKELNKFNPNISLEKEKEYIRITKNICSNNKDIFEKFYEENNELYGEMTNKLLKLRK